MDAQTKVIRNAVRLISVSGRLPNETRQLAKAIGNLYEYLDGSIADRISLSKRVCEIEDQLEELEGEIRKLKNNRA